MQAHRTAKFVPVFVRTAAILGLAIALFSTGTATAQRPGGFQRPGNNNQGEQNDTNRREGERTTQNRGPGGVFQFGRQGSQGVMGTIFRQEAQQDAGLTPELVSKITEVINAQQQQNPDDFRLIGEQMRNAQSDEERAALRDEMSKMFAERAKQTEEEIAKVVSPEQMTRLRQLTLQFDGARALQQETVVKDLKISEEQETKIAELLQQQGEAWRELGFRASPEERQALEREWTGKIFSVLTPEQQATWNQKVGTVITTNGIPGSPAAAPGTTPRTTSAAPNRAITTDIGSTVIRPDGDSQQVLASFDAASTAKTATESPATTAPATTPPADAASEVAPAAAPRVVGFRTLPQASKEKVSFNFRYAPWADVLKQFASLAGLTLDLTTAVPGTFNYYDQGEYTPLEALDIINGYLIQKGYTLLRRDQFLVVINMDNGIPPNLIELIPVSELPARGRFEFLKIRMTIKGITADVAAKEVEALLGSHGTVVPMRTSNSLLITDIGDNLRAITQLLSDVATQEDPAEVIFQQILVKYLDVEDAEQMLRTQFGLNVAANVSAFTGDDRRRSSDTSVNTATGSIKISSDVRTQSLLVTAPRSQIALMEAFLQAVDIDIAGDGSRSASQNQKPFLRSYTLKTASAREVSKTLTALLPPGMVINEDGEARRVHILATESEHVKVAKMIEDLDTDPGTVAAEVYFLSKTDPVGAASMLESLFIAEAVPPIIKADTFGRSLIIRGSFEQMAQIKKIMAQLGEDGTGVVADDAPANPFLRISIGDRDATEVLNLFERSWKQSEPTPIRIVIPAGTRDPIKQELVPSATSRTTSPAPAPTPVPRPASLEGGRQTPATSPTGASVDDALLQFFLRGSGTGASTTRMKTTERRRQRGRGRAPGTPARARTAAERQSRAAADRSSATCSPAQGDEGVTIINQGDSLLLYSNDPAKLKRAQELIQAIGMALPPRPSWTLFYLRTTDATEVAYMLEQLIPDSSVSSSSMESDGSLFGGLTNQLMGLGQTLAEFLRTEFALHDFVDAADYP
jgi:type II secretory pathway component GspD/PulD (secretin)